MLRLFYDLWQFSRAYYDRFALLNWSKSLHYNRRAQHLPESCTNPNFLIRINLCNGLGPNNCRSTAISTGRQAFEKPREKTIKNADHSSDSIRQTEIILSQSSDFVGPAHTGCEYVMETLLDHLFLLWNRFNGSFSHGDIVSGTIKKNLVYKIYRK